MPCTECFHDIPAGSACLSQMPETMPEKFRRKKYENFCVSCAKCEAKNKLPCYARRLDHWHTYERKTAEPAACGYCGDAIPEGAWTVAQKIYALPEPEVEGVPTDGDGDGDAPIGSAASGAAASAAKSASGSGAWGNLSPQLQRRFMTGGLRAGSRTPTMARRLYEKEIPAAVRNLGEDAVRDFMNGRQFSHIKSVFNAPDKAKFPSNVIPEDGAKNMARGSQNMTSAELAAAKSAGRAAAKSAGRAAAAKIGAKSALKGGAKAGAAAAAVEAPVSGMENFFHWKRGRKSGKQAAKDTAKDTGVAAGVGVAGVVIVKGGVALAASVKGGAMLTAAGTALAPLGTPLMIAGVGFVAVSAAHRIIKASKHDLPLDEYYIHFCKDGDCKTQFAAEITKAAQPNSMIATIRAMLRRLTAWRF